MTKDLDKKVAHAMELHYERGFIDGMQKQMQSSVDMAVNRMAQTQEPVPPPWWNAVENILNEYGLQAIDFVADFKQALAQTQEPWCMKMNGCKIKCEDCPDEPPQRTWVDLTDEEIQVVAKQARSKDHAVTLTNKLLREKNT
jgi:hypothetical protein